MAKDMLAYINPSTLIAQVRMSRRKNQNQTYLVVEGESDIKLFRNIIEKRNCNIFPLDGKDKVVSAMKLANSQCVKGVVGIADRDYDMLLNKDEDIGNLFFTDTHDIETMILKTSAFEKFQNEYGNDKNIEQFEKKQSKTVLQAIIDIGRYIGCLRLVSAKYKYNFSFKDIEIRTYINNQLEFDKDSYLNQVLYISKKTSERDTIIQKIDYELRQNYDIWHLCRGHDLTQIIAAFFSNGCKNTLGNSSAAHIGSNHVEIYLRAAYSIEMFYRTKLYHKLFEWQNIYADWIILRKEDKVAA